MKKYLVIGGSGFIGSKLVSKLKNNNRIIVADRYSANSDCFDENVEFLEMDFTKTESFKNSLTGVDTVVHLVSTVFPEDGTDGINDEIRDNVFPTIRLLDDMTIAGVKSIIFVSSGGTVYGNQEVYPIKEDHSEKPICKYAVHKVVIEKYLNLYQHYHDIDYKIIRLGNPYGFLENSNRTQGLIPIIIKKIIEGGEITIWGDGTNIRDYIYIDDAIDAIIRVDRDDSGKRIFNVGSGIGYSTNQVIDMIKDIMKDYQVKLNYIESRKCDLEKNILDITRITESTDWKPKVVLTEGIKLTLNDLLSKNKY